jgi:hypothetical protein
LHGMGVVQVNASTHTHIHKHTHTHTYTFINTGPVAMCLAVSVAESLTPIRWR